MTSKSASIQCPVGGLNDRDAISNMGPQYAVILENWWCQPSWIEIRPGSSSHSTGYPAAVETLASYYPGSGSEVIFAVSNGAIYNATSPGAVGAAVQTGLSNSRFETANISTPGGSFIYFVNGVDSPRLWNGTSWVTVTGVSTPAITGVTTSTLANICLFKNRLFFVQKNSLNIYYLPVNSVGGAASLLDMGSIFKRGGKIVACSSWTIDAGDGADDHFAIVTSEGEIAVYSGTDPSSASTWSLIGVYAMGRPLGVRCFVKFGGDLAYSSVEGIFPMSKALLSSSISRVDALTDKIQNSTRFAAESYKNNFGWQVETYPEANILLLNVPAGNGQNYQYAQNTITGAWAKFTGWNANCWLNSSYGFFYGSSNSVVKAWVGNLDNTVPITADVLPSFSYFGSLGRNKFFTMVRPYFVSNGNPSFNYSLNTNFSVQPANVSLQYNPPTGMTWGSMTWGSMTWGGAYVQTQNWATVGAIANSAALRLFVLGNGSSVRLTNIDYFYQIGGVL